MRILEVIKGVERRQVTYYSFYWLMEHLVAEKQSNQSNIQKHIPYMD